MKYYAAEGRVSQQPIEGGIEISAEQYQKALSGMAQGHVVTSEGGFAVGPKPEPEMPEPEPPTIEELAANKRSEINAARDTTLQAGLSYTMPDGSQETVQTRAQDEPSLLGLAIEARDLVAEGVTDPVLVLRVESNRNYQLTPQQMIDLTDAAKNQKKLILGKSWQLKDAVDAALAAEDREAIEAIEW